MSILRDKYETQNIEQEASETDEFTYQRYKQFFTFFPKNSKTVLDVGCSTGRGGVCLVELDPALTLVGLDCVQKRLDALPKCYSQGLYGLSTTIPVEDCFFDVIVAGEFIQCLYPADVDRTLCEFQRVLKVGGRLMLTVWNPVYLKHRVGKISPYSHSALLSQHPPEVLRFRLLMHGFSRVKIYGSGKVSQYLGWYFPFLAAYGSYLIMADKY